MKKLMLIGLMGLVFAGGAPAATETTKGENGGRRSGELREVFRANHEARREHMEEQKGENKEFREGLSDMEPGERIAAIIAHRKEKHRENEKFHAKLHKALVKAIKACETIPDDKKDELLEKVNERYSEAVEFHSDIHADVMEFLRDLQGSESTPQEKKAAWEEFHEGIRDRIEAWRDEHRPKRRPRSRDDEE